MDERISFVTHQGKTIMLIDFSGCTAKEMMPLLDQVQHAVARHDRNSLLTLADVTDAHLDRNVAMRIKEVLVLDRPYVKRAAWVGSESLPKVYLDNFKSFSQRDIPPFATREEAMDWLVSE
jgi:hypothetical protein